MAEGDRRRLVELLHGGRGWTIERIAKALNVTTDVISKEICDLDNPSKQPDKLGRRRGLWDVR